MAIHVRYSGEVAVLSGVGRLMNDPRYFDSIRDIRELIDQGRLRFIFDLRGVNETGPTVLGLLTTLTRLIRQEHGEVVLANPSRPMAKFLDEMRMDDYWDVFDDLNEAVEFLEKRRVGPPIVYE